MRIVKCLQSSFGQVDIAKIELSARSRDDIPAVLKGLQYLYINAEIRDRVFALLDARLGAGRKNDARDKRKQRQIHGGSPPR
jgi:IS5 family transposase